MRLTKNSMGQIFPFDEHDRPMFSHCSNGSISVTEEYFADFVCPLLVDHGVENIEINGKSFSPTHTRAGDSDE